MTIPRYLAHRALLGVVQVLVVMTGMFFLTEALPVDFDLLRQFNGEPLPVDWQGTIRGTVRGRGGPVTRFVVDDARVAFADARLEGEGLDAVDIAAIEVQGAGDVVLKVREAAIVADDVVLDALGEAAAQLARG